MRIVITGRWVACWLASLAVPLAAVAPAESVRPAWFVRTWQSDAGLPDNTVMGIDQTPDGFLWVATSTGLVRFDGVQFRPFAVAAPGMPAGRIKALVADRRNRVWVAKDQGVVVCVDQGRATMVVGPEYAASDSPYRGMVQDAEGAVWVSYGDGAVLRIQDGRVRAFTAADGLPAEGFCHLALDGTGRLWFSRGDWIGIFGDGQFRKLWQTPPVPLITGAHAGGAWAYANRKVWKYTESGPPVKLGSLPADTPEVGVISLREDHAGGLWLGTREAGLFRFDRAGAATAVMSQQTIASLKVDQEGSLWVGTRGGGLSQLRPRVIDLLTPGSTPQFQGVRSICQDADGLLWAIVWPNGGILRNAGQDWTPLSTNAGWSVPDAQGLAADPQGGVWIGTSSAGLYRWRNGTVTDILCTTNGLGGNWNGSGCNWVSALLATTSGEVWIGAGGADVQHPVLQRRKAGQLRTFNLPTGSGPVLALATDAAGDCWAATSGGLLLRVHADVLTDESGSVLAEPHEIRCLLGTPDGSLWIGYGGQGLGRLKAGRFSRCRMDQRLHDDYISNMLPDGHGRLWFAGNRGIFSVRQKDLDDLAEGRATRVWPAAYGRSDGLPMLQASCDSWPGALRGTDGRLLFAMQSGVAVVYADNLQENPLPPPVVIERVTVNGKPVAVYGAGGALASASAVAPLELCQGGVPLRLPPGQRRVEFVFTALTLRKPESIGFKYRLRGLDADWVEAGTRRVATYAQLPPGHYHFEVTACNSDAVWNKTAAALELTAEPYWWETAWFWVAGPLSAAGLLAAAIVLGLRRRHRRQIERLEMLQATEQERARIARDLHDDLGGGLTEIAMLSEVARQACDQPREVDAHLERIFRSSREMTQALDEIVWAVNPANDTLEKLIAFTSEFAREMLEPAGIRYRLEAPAAVPMVALNSQIRHQLCMALKECLHNIVKHAHAHEVHIRIGLNDRTLAVTIVDDGAGFDPAALPDQAGTHSGLANLRQRMANIGGTCELHSAPGQGTRVQLQARI